MGETGKMKIKQEGEAAEAERGGSLVTRRQFRVPEPALSLESSVI